MMRSLILFFAFILPGLAFAEEDYRARNEAIIEQYIVPGYQQFAASVSTLREPLEILCATLSADALADAQTTFSDVMTAWQRVQHIRLGPVQLDDRLFRISFWPDPRNFTGRQLASTLESADPELLEEGVVGDRSVAIQGLMTLERLLFADAPAQNGGYPCEYAKAIAANLSQMATEIEQEWTQPGIWLDIIQAPGPDNEIYQSDKELTGEIFKALSTGFQVLKDQKLVSVIGTEDQQPKPRRAEAWRSGNSLSNIRASLAALDEMIQIGYGDILNASADDGAETMRQIIRDANLALDNIQHPLPEASENEDDRKWLTFLVFQITAAQEVLAGEIVPALDLPLSFNALDGD